MPDDKSFLLSAGSADRLNCHSPSPDNLNMPVLAAQKGNQLIIPALCELALQKHAVRADIRHLDIEHLGNLEHLFLLRRGAVEDFSKQNLLHMQRHVGKVNHLNHFHHAV